MRPSCNPRYLFTTYSYLTLLKSDVAGDLGMSFVPKACKRLLFKSLRVDEWSPLALPPWFALYSKSELQYLTYGSAAGLRLEP